MHIVAANMVLFISTRSKLSSNRGSASSLTLHASRSGFACGNTILVTHLSKNTLGLTEFMTKLYNTKICSLNSYIVNQILWLEKLSIFLLLGTLDFLTTSVHHYHYWKTLENIFWGSIIIPISQGFAECYQLHDDLL